MTKGSQEQNESNQETFLECFSAALLERISRPAKKSSKKRAGRKTAIKPVHAKPSEGQDEDLSDFIEVNILQPHLVYAALFTGVADMLLVPG